MAVDVRLVRCEFGVGECIRFEVTSREPTAARYDLRLDGGAPFEEGVLTLSDEPVSITAEPMGPGFVALAVWGEDDWGPVRAVAAVTPRDITPSLASPVDFDAFWAGKLAPVREFGAAPEVVSHRSYPTGTAHAVRVPMPDGSTVYAWLLLPHSPPPYPAVVRFHGAGVYAVSPENGLDWTGDGAMVLSVNPHPIPNDRPRDYYESLRTGKLADYRTRGRDSREDSYFVGMFLRAVRAADFLASRSEWDGENLVAEGHSQGGGQAIAAAALNPRVTGLVVSCPTHCDHTGPVIGRAAGWPQIVEVGEEGPDRGQVEAARYVDAVNLAARVTCPALCCVCFLDDLCPPTGVYAACNALGGPTTVVHEPGAGHTHTDAFQERTHTWVMDMLE